MANRVIGLWAVLGLAAWAVSAESSARAGEKTPHVFIGVEKCKICHKTVEQGEQYRIWSESAHAKAYETLASDKAKAFAKEKGIANPQEAGECLRCHVTAYGVAAEFIGEKHAKTDGVGCESCHGAGGDYSKKKTMEGITSGEIDGATVGLVMPTEQTCTTCHNKESPTFTSFDFKKMAEKIKHPLPAERKAKYKTSGK